MSDEKKAKLTSSFTADTVSRRGFFTRVGAAAGATALTTYGAGAHAATQASASQPAQPDASIPGTVPVSLKVNGELHKVQVDPRATLLDTLRETLQLTGTKKGCDHGQCGACTVHINGKRANSCLALTVMQQNAEITTIEGLGSPGNLHSMQQAFVEHDGFQCGYCTPGQIMSAVAMLKEPWGTSDTEVKEAMSGNICRCGAYLNILAAIKSARGKA
jgi:xanthine dehydrogenase YagT iron-sulfur-binding subunit